MKYRWLILLINVIVALVLVSPALAHANLARSTPAANASLLTAPKEIRLWFTEPLEPSFSRFSLRDSRGNPVQTPASRVDPTNAHQMFMQSENLANGLYTVTWRAVSAADGHSTEGSFAFGIGVAVANNPASAIDESVSLEGVFIRWLNLLSLSLAVGAVAFWLFVWQSAVREDYAVVRQQWYRLTWAGWLGVGIATLLLLLLQVATDANTSLTGALLNPALGTVLTTTFGIFWFARLGLWVVFGLALWRSSRRNQMLWIVLAVGLMLLVGQSLFSHASAAPDRTAAVANDWLHLVSTALWVGGLASFAFALLTLRRETTETTLTARLVSAFSGFARVAVALVIVTGLYAAWLEVGSLPALLETLYGQALLVKGVLLLPLLALAAINLITTQRQLSAGNVRWVRHLRGLVGAEIALAAGILLAVSVISSGSPARGVLALRQAAESPAQSQPYFDMNVVDNQMLHLQIVPGFVGKNEFIITPYDVNAKPMPDVSLIRLRFTNLDQNLGESELRPQPNGDGEYRVSGDNLSIPGQWRIRMTLERPGKFDIVTDFKATIGPPPPEPSIDVITAVPLSQRPIAAALAGLGLLGISAFFFVQTRRPFVSAANLLMLAGIAVGLIFLVGSAADFSTNALTAQATGPGGPAVSTQQTLLTNPVQPDAASISTGHTLFIQNCVLCHGSLGKGDGPVGVTLNPRPADLSLHAKPGVHPDGQLFAWITDGYPGSAMPAFGHRLSDTDRWNLVNYIRTLAQLG